MLSIENINELSKRNMKAMSDNMSRKFEVYRSSNLNLTREYYGNGANAEFFELVCFGYAPGKRQFYLRYPGMDFFIELYGNCGSSWGTMTECHLRNIHEEEVNPFIFDGILRPRKCTIYKHETDAFIQFDQTHNFNFLKLCYDQTVQDVHKVFDRLYVPLPEYKNIHYAYITNDKNFILVDGDAFNFQYDTMRCFYGNFHNGIKEGMITDFTRYRDGGTTHFNMTLDDKIHKFYFPSTLTENKLVPLWNDQPIELMSKDLKNIICDNLNIKLQPKVALD